MPLGFLNVFFRNAAILLITLLPLSGCQSTGGANSSNDGELSGFARMALCTAGGVLGAWGGKELADAYFKRYPDKFDDKEQEEYTRAFQVGMFISFCAITDYAGRTIYKSLSEAGQEKRRQQVLAAAQSTEPTTYRDPSNPRLEGTVKPLSRYKEVASNRECVDMEDTLADGSNSETIYIKYCRDLPNGPYRPVTV